MSNNPNPSQSEENKRILRELDEQKRKMKLAQQQQGLGQPPTLSSPVIPHRLFMDGPASISSSQNAAARTIQHKQMLLEAQANSFGFYIMQDSMFGNPILPVIPRFDSEKS